MAVAAAPARSRLITSTSMGPVKLGMTVAAARKAVPGCKLERTTDGDGLALIAVKVGKEGALTLYAGEADPGKPVKDSARIELIETRNAGYQMANGIRPGMLLRDAERKLGKVTRVDLSEIESREYATFAKGPAGITFRVEAKDGSAGKYARPGPPATATAYTATARIVSIIVQKR